jgi:hypothetical protein
VLFPRGKGELLRLLSCLGVVGQAGKVKCGVQTWNSGLRAPNLMFPAAQKAPRRELTPVRLCSVRLSWRQRARPSTTLHEIQICRSRLEYIVCTTGWAGPQLWRNLTRKLYRPDMGGWVYWADGACTNIVEEMSPMKSEFEFAGNFGMSVLLLAGSFAVAQSATTANAKKAGPTTSAAAVAGSSSQGTPAAQTTQAAAVTNSQTAEAVVPPAATQPQPSATTTKPKTMVSADKRTIPVPQL